MYFASKKPRRAGHLGSAALTLAVTLSLAGGLTATSAFAAEPDTADVAPAATHVSPFVWSDVTADNDADPIDCAIGPTVSGKHVTGITYTITVGDKALTTQPGEDDSWIANFGWGETVMVTASADEGYEFADYDQTKWEFTAPAHNAVCVGDQLRATEEQKADLQRAIDTKTFGHTEYREAEYTPDSWQTFVAELADIRQILDNADVTNDDIIDAWDRLYDAAFELEFADEEDPDAPLPQDELPTSDELAALGNAVDAATKSTPGKPAPLEKDYTAKSWQTFAAALADAQQVLETAHKGQAPATAVRAATDALTKAQAALKAKPQHSDTTTNGSTDAEKPGSAPDAQPQSDSIAPTVQPMSPMSPQLTDTGSNAGLLSLGAVTLLALGGASVSLARKQR